MRPNEGTFSDVFSNVVHDADDRRHYQRRAGAFELRWTLADAIESATQTAVGTEISANGLVFINAEPIEPAQLNVTFSLAGRLIAAKVRLVRQDRVVLGGRPAYRSACEFCGVRVEDWDWIERYANGDEPAVEERTKARKASDAYLLLPSELQRKIVEALIAEERLEAPAGNSDPELELYYSGATQHAGEKPVHRVHVHSRKRAPTGELIAYDTRFVVSDDGGLEFA
jgi:hypothetical protein